MVVHQLAPTIISAITEQYPPHMRGACQKGESYMAVASAQHNWQALFEDRRPARFEVGDCLGPVPAESVNLILCNPPFHQHIAMGDATAWRMFTEARRVLRSGGELLVVGNRHLAYHAKLRRLFGHCEVVDSDRKFVVLRSRQR